MEFYLYYLCLLHVTLSYTDNYDTQKNRCSKSSHCIRDQILLLLSYPNQISKQLPEDLMALLTLPPELYFELAAFLEAKDLVTLLHTSKQVYPIIEYILYYRDTKSNAQLASSGR